MPTRVDVPGMGIVEFPDGMSDAQISAAIQKNTTPPPSRMATFGNALMKGAAGFGDMIGSGLVNTANLGLAAAGTTGRMLGAKASDMPDLIPADALSGYKKIGESTGLIDQKREPQDMKGRLIDVTGQVIGGGGINPVAAGRSLARGAVLPVVRDLAAATAGGVSSGLAGEAVRNVNTGNETVDRLIKILAPLAAGAVPSAVLASRGTAGDRASAALNGVTEQQIKQAKAIEEKARAAGTPVTGYEAVQGVTGTNPKMQTQQRVTEQSDAGGKLLTPIMQNRPANNAAYFERVAGGISPAEKYPDVLAGQLQGTAEKSIDAARQAGNAQAAPFYGASSNNPSVKIPAHDWNAITADPAIAWALEQVKKNPLLGVKNATEGSVQWLDAAKKFLDSKGQSLQQAGDRFPASAASDAAQRITQSVDPLVPAYAQARGIVAKNMRDVVVPMQNSQVGKLTESNQFKTQAGALLPENPMDVTPAVVERTIKTLSAQDPDIARRFISQYLRGTFNESSGGGVSNNAFGGYQFAKKVADNPGQQANLLKAIEASGASPAAIQDALDIFRAQGMRPPVNSATSANLAESAAMGGKMADILMRPFKTAGNAVDMWRNGMATKDLAKALSDPNSIQRLQELARANGTYNPLTQQMLAQMLLSSRQNSAPQTAEQ